MRPLAVLLTVFCLAHPSFALGEGAPDLRVRVAGNAYVTWPVAFAASIGDALVAPPNVVFCCASERQPGTWSGTRRMARAKQNMQFEIAVVWTEWHSRKSYFAEFSVDSEDLPGWRGVEVDVELVFGLNGALRVLVPGEALAKTKPELSTEKPLTSQSLGDFLKAPGLGRPIRLTDYTVLLDLCGSSRSQTPSVLATAIDRFPSRDRDWVVENSSGPKPPLSCPETN